MQLESYFDFISKDDIRIKDTRIGIESVLYEYIHRSQSSEAIGDRFPSLSLAQIYATILYYLHNREAVDTYMADWLADGEQQRTLQDREPPPVVSRLSGLKIARLASPAG
jgi:uncharacterized protein (DUF433 family)